MSDTKSAAPELILVIENSAAGAAWLEMCLAETEPACVIFTGSEGLRSALPDAAPAPDAEGAAVDVARLRSLVEAAQAAGAAALIQNDAATAKAVDADGVHITASAGDTKSLEAARAGLGRTATVGALCDATRHTAMLLGEAGADYIGFDLRGDARDDGLEMVTWWAELFEVPVIAFIDVAPAAARAARAAGADFLALCPPVLDATATPDLLITLGTIMSDIHAPDAR